MSWTILHANFTQLLFFFFFWLHHMACGILTPQPGMEPRVEAQSLKHGAAWEVSPAIILKLQFCLGSVTFPLCLIRLLKIS